MSVRTKKLLGPAAIALLLVACSSQEESAEPAAPAAAQPAAAESEAAAPAAESSAMAAAPAAESPPVAETPSSAAANMSAAPAETAAAEAPDEAPEDVPEGAYAETIEVFRNAGASAAFFDKSYGYAVFPTVGKGGLGVGAARGKGQVYVGGKHVGNATLTQLSIGLQAGGQAFSEIVFFEDKRAFDEFASGDFAFGAGVSAVAITAGAAAGAGTSGGAAAGASASQDAATTAGNKYYKGMAVFTVVKGGLMASAAVGGQKFKYEAI